MPQDNILTEIAWINTSEGLQTPETTLKNASALTLDQNSVKGYEYGAQQRFLMSIFALICAELTPNQTIHDITDTHIDTVLTKLEPSAHLFHPTNPFMQLPAEYINPDALNSDAVQKPWIKISPSIPADNQRVFWDLDTEELNHDLPLHKAVLLLVAASYYTGGGNAKIDSRAPKNFTPALRYPGKGSPPAVEIIPLGDDLLTTLALTTPKQWVTDAQAGVHPSWADRTGTTLPTNSTHTTYWLSSWSYNGYYCNWNEDHTALHTVGTGGGPNQWMPKPLFSPNENEQTKTPETLPKGKTLQEVEHELQEKQHLQTAKRIHDHRTTTDPLYFYYPSNDKEPKPKMWYMDLASDPYYFISLWNAEQLSQKLTTKLTQTIQYTNPNDIANLLFLSHDVGGTAQSFTIRYSTITEGWKDEILPAGDLERVSDMYSSVMAQRKRLLQVFNSGQPLEAYSERRNALEQAYWNEVQETVTKISSNTLKPAEVKQQVQTAAVKALYTTFNRRNLTIIENLLKAENIIRGKLS